MNTLGMKRSDPIASNAHVCIGKFPEATTRNETKRNKTKRGRGEDANFQHPHVGTAPQTITQLGDYDNITMK